jgi:outer membrane protein TolC
MGIRVLAAASIASLLILADPARGGADPGAGDAGEVYSLERCLAFALENSRQLRDATLGLDIARKQVREAWGEILPKVDATMTYTRNLSDQEQLIPAVFIDPSGQGQGLIPVRFTLDNVWNATVSLEQPLFQAEVFIGVGAAGRFKQLQVERTRGTAHQVVTEVRNAYYAALLQRENVNLIEESLRRVGETLRETQGLNRAGLSSNYDVLRLEVEYGNLEPNLRRARNALTSAKRDLKVAMGLDVATPLDLAGSLITADFSQPATNDPENLAILRVAGVSVTSEEDLPRLMELRSRYRSDLRESRVRTSLAETQLAAERATLYPKLSAFANYQLSAQEDGSPDFFGEESQDRIDNWQAGLRLELPIFEGFQRYSRIAQRRLEVRQRETEERLIEDQAINEVRTLLDGLLEARERIESRLRAVNQALRGFEIASTQYREGLGSQLQVTDAEEALRLSQFNYSQAAFDVLAAQAALDAAVGVVPMVDEIEERS